MWECTTWWVRRTKLANSYLIISSGNEIFLSIWQNFFSSSLLLLQNKLERLPIESKFILIKILCTTHQASLAPGNTKGGSITVLLTSCLTGLESAVWQLTIFVFICKTYYSKPVKEEVMGTVILQPIGGAFTRLSRKYLGANTLAYCGRVSTTNKKVSASDFQFDWLHQRTFLKRGIENVHHTLNRGKMNSIRVDYFSVFEHSLANALLKLLTVLEYFSWKVATLSRTWGGVTKSIFCHIKYSLWKGSYLL